jgi:hypothetical protein
VSLQLHEPSPRVLLAFPTSLRLETQLAPGSAGGF